MKKKKKLKLRCSNKECEKRSGFNILESQYWWYMKENCPDCKSKLINIGLVKDESD